MKKILHVLHVYTAQKMRLSIKDFFSKCDQKSAGNRGKLRIWLYLLKKSLMEYFIFCAVLHLKPQSRGVFRAQLIIYDEAFL